MKPYVTFTDDAILEGLTPQQELPEGQTRESSLEESLPAPIPEEVKDTQAEDLGVPSISQEANELDATEEPTDKLAVLTATVGEPAKVPDIPCVQQEDLQMNWPFQWPLWGNQLRSQILPYAAGGGRREDGPE